MGRDQNESGGRKPRPQTTVRVDNFAVYRPTKAEQDAIKANAETLQGCLEGMARLLEEGHKLHLGFKPENSAYYLHLREGNVDWDKAITVSCWHTDVLRVFQMMVHAIRTRYREFPLIQLSLPSDAPDW